MANPLDQKTPFDATIPGQIKNFYTSLPSSFLKVGKDIAQGVARSVGSAAISLARPFTGADTATAEDSYTPELFKAFFGPEPVKDLSSRIAESEIKLQQNPFAKKLGLDQFALPLSFAGVVGMTAADLTPFGFEGKEGASALKTLSETLSKIGDDPAVSSLLRKSRFSEELIGQYAPSLAKETNPSIIERTLKAAEQVQKDSAAFRSGLSKIPEETTPALKVDIFTPASIEKLFERSPLKPGDIITNTEGDRMIIKSVQDNLTKRTLKDGEIELAVTSPDNPKALTRSVYIKPNKINTPIESFESPPIDKTAQATAANEGAGIPDAEIPPSVGEIMQKNPIAALSGMDTNAIGRTLSTDEIRAIANARDIDEIAGVLKAAGYADDIVTRFAPELFGMSTPKEVNDAIEAIRHVDALKKTDTATGEMLKLQNTPADALLNLNKEEDAGSWKSLVKGYMHTAKKGAKAHILDYLATPEYVLEKLGLGKAAEALHDARDGMLTTLKGEFQRIEAWKARTSGPDAARSIFQYLDGQEAAVAPYMSEDDLTVAKEIREYLKEWAERLKLPEDNQISRYITHIFERDFTAPEGQSFVDPEMAALMSDQVAKSVYDPFLQKRLGKGGYIEDVWRALDAYVKRGARKEAMDPALEMLEKEAKLLDDRSYKYVMDYSHRVNMRPTELEKGMDSFITQTPLGHYFTNRPVSYLSNKIRGMFYRGTLGLNFSSALRNLSQGANTYAKLGEKHTVIGYAKLLGKLASRDLSELYTNNVLSDAIVQDRATGVIRKKLQAMDKGLFAMFDLAEKINRGSAYFGAKSKALEKGLSEEEAIKYAKRIVRETQFSFGAVDTPVALNDDVVKTLTQLQSYNIKQAEFFIRMAKNKEFGGLIRWIASALGFTYTIGRAFGMSPEQLIPTIGFGGAPLTSTVGAVSDLFSTNEQDQKQAQEQLKRNLMTTLPAGAQLRKTIQGAAAYSEGEDTTKTGRHRYDIPQTPLNLIRVLLFGKYSLPEAQEYFDKLDDKGKAAGGGGNPLD